MNDGPEGLSQGARHRSNLLNVPFIRVARFGPVPDAPPGLLYVPFIRVVRVGPVPDAPPGLLNVPFIRVARVGPVLDAPPGLLYVPFIRVARRWMGTFIIENRDECAHPSLFGHMNVRIQRPNRQDCQYRPASWRA